MKSNRGKKKDTMFLSIFISYCIACVIIMGITGLGYANYYRIFKENTETAAAQQAAIIAAQVNEDFVRIIQAMETFSQNNTIKKFMADEEDNSKDGAAMKDFQDDLSMRLMSSEFVDSYAYFYESQSLIGARSRRYNANMLQMFLSWNDMTQEQFLEITGFGSSWGSYVFEDGKIWLMRAVYDEKLVRKGVIIVESMLRGVMKLRNEAYKDNLVLMAAGDIVLYSNQQLSPEDMGKIVPAASTSRRISLSKGSYYFVEQDIQSMNWQCMVGIPTGTLFKELRIFWIVLVLELVGAVILMLFMSWRFARRTYRPVEQLMDILGSGNEERFQKTYDSLCENLKSLKEDNRRMKKNEQSSRMDENRQQMMHIMRGDITDQGLMRTIIEEFSGIGGHDLWLMILVRIQEDPAGIFSYDQYAAQDVGNMDLKSFVLKNVLNETLFEQFTGNVVLMDDNYIVCVRLENAGQLSGITEKLQTVIDFYKSALNTEIYVMMGQCTQGYQEVKDIYEELAEEMRNHYFWMDDSTRGRVWQVDYGVQEQSVVAANEYLDANRRLINALDAADYSEASKIMEYIFGRTFSRDKRYLEYNIYRMYGLISTVTMALNLHVSPEDKEFLEQLDYESRMFSAQTVDQLMTESRKILTALISYDSERKKDGAPSWLPPMLEYIKKNLTDANLSVAEIGEKFNLSVPHLSRTFKTWMGCGMLEYIHKLRVEEAKKYLLEGKSISATAVRVGYLDGKSLTRAFRRCEGITPGQFKENQSKIKNEIK